MKKLLLFLIGLAGNTQITFLQYVQKSDPNNCNEQGEALYTYIVTNKNGIPYVVCADSLAGWKTTVMKYNGT